MRPQFSILVILLAKFLQRIDKHSKLTEDDEGERLLRSQSSASQDDDVCNLLPNAACIVKPRVPRSPEGFALAQTFESNIRFLLTCFFETLVLLLPFITTSL